MQVNALIQELTVSGPVLTDGAWGTELQARGLDTGEMPDLWSLSHPEQVEEVACAYVDAGSQVVLTNTFRANRIALAQHPERERVAEINRAGVEISRRAAGGRARVFASIGPSGKLLLGGGVDKPELRAAFSEQARALADGGADAIVVETMADLAEAELAIEAVKETGLPVVACMVFDSGRNKNRTMMGVTPTQAAQVLTELGADVIGANCGSGIEDYIPVCASLAAATQRPIWIKPNAGIPVLADGKVVYPTTPDEFAQKLDRLLEAGAQFVGGCCGTSPEFIAAIRAHLGPR
jgi:methionine synthase I (cobalamin-dependent)